MKAIGITGVTLALLGALAAYAWFGMFRVAPDEQAVVLRIGRLDRTVGPGIHFYALGLERYEKATVTRTLEQEFGYRTVQEGSEYEDRPSEKEMISGDANLVNVEFVVQYRIGDLAQYVLRVEDVEGVIRDTALASLQEVVATRAIDAVLTDDRSPIEIEARDLIRRVLAGYETGIEIQRVVLQDVEPPQAVKDAFADVASAEQDRERMILEAQGYADQVVPRARGESEEAINQARAYRERRTLSARGEAGRFTALLEEYRKAPGVTRERLYLETLEKILPRMEKVIVDEDNSERVLPYLPLGRRGVAK